jgi:hypothetical protein
MGYGDISGVDPAEEVARVAVARRTRLLRIYRRRLRLEDLEDCYSQATLELLARSRNGLSFASREHLANLLELRFKSRIDDRRRAVEGRSAIEAALAHAVPVDAAGRGAAELEDRRAEVERQVFARTEVRRLRELIADLSRDQQLVLGSQILVDIEPVEFCARHGWTVEKYRKVAQRARGKLRVLVDEYERGERCRRLEPDLVAFGAGAAAGGALERARTHVSNCRNCARMIGELGRNGHSALLPLPAALAGGIGAKLTGAYAALRRALGFVRHPIAGASRSGGTGVAGGSLAGAGALKVGIVAVCVAGAAGSYAACSHLGVLPALGLAQVRHHAGHHRTPTAPHRHRAVGVGHGDAHAETAPAQPAHMGLTSSQPAVVASEATSSERITARAAAPARHRTSHLTAVEQIRREFGAPLGRAASAGASAHPVASHSDAASRRALAQIRREFGRPVARAASSEDAPVTAVGSVAPSSRPASGSGAATGSGTAAGSGTATGTTPAPSTASTGTNAATPPGTAPAVAEPQPPKQRSAQAGQTQAEFGFEK